MKSKEVKVTREGKKRFDVRSEYDGVNPGLGYSGNGSYLRLSMAETLQEMLRHVLVAFGLDKEFIVVVREKELPQEQRIAQEIRSNSR